MENHDPSSTQQLTELNWTELTHLSLCGLHTSFLSLKILSHTWNTNPSKTRKLHRQNNQLDDRIVEEDGVIG